MRQPEIRCVEFVEQATEWLEGALADDARQLVEEHLVICPHCTEYVSQLRAATRTLRLVDDSPPRDVRETLLEAFRRQRRA